MDMSKLSLKVASIFITIFTIIIMSGVNFFVALSYMITFLALVGILAFINHSSES